MTSFKKIFLAFLMAGCLLCTSAAFAAKVVPGSVPFNKPLQPLPADVAPNFSENIQASHGEESPPASEQVPSADQRNKSPQEESPYAPTKHSLFLSWTIGIIIAVMAVGAGYGVYLRLKKDGRK